MSNRGDERGSFPTTIRKGIENVRCTINSYYQMEKEKLGSLVFCPLESIEVHDHSGDGHVEFQDGKS